MLLLLHFWHRVVELMARLQILLRLPAHMKYTANRNIYIVPSSVAQGNSDYHKKETIVAHFHSASVPVLDDRPPPILAVCMIFMLRCQPHIHNI